MHRRATRTRHLTLALVACLLMVLLSPQAALCFGRAGHMVLEVDHGGCHGEAQERSHRGYACAEEHCGDGDCIRVGVLKAAPNRAGSSESIPVPRVSTVVHLEPPPLGTLTNLAPLTTEHGSSPPLLLVSLRSTILRI